MVNLKSLKLELEYIEDVLTKDVIKIFLNYLESLEERIKKLEDNNLN